MNTKPQDLLIGVIDLFVIILPGSLLIFGVLRFLTGFPGEPLPATHLEGWQGAAAFAFASYLLGHLVSLLGSFAEDTWYKLRERWPSRRPPVPEGKARPRPSEEGDSAQLRPGVESILRSRYGLPVEGNYFKVRRWALKAVRLTSDLGASTLDRKDADRRFFRNVTVVLPMIGLGIVVRGLAEAGNDPFLLLEGFVWLTLAWASLRRYKDQHKKFTREVFEYFVMVHRKAGPAAGPDGD